MENVLPPAEELRLIDRELVQLDSRRAQLMHRRAWLLTALRAAGAGPAPVPARSPGAAAETSPPSAQNILLTLGGILLTIAAVAFTLVSWGRMGIGGRAVVLGAVTVTALGTPLLLLRRRLVSTAESVAALGLVLTVLDAYALKRAVLPGTDAVAYTAVAAGVLAAAWAAYGRAVGRLRLPLPGAVVAGQLPLPLWALSAGGGPEVTAWATLATAGLDVAIALVARGTAVRALAVTGAVVTGGWSLLTGVWLSVSAGSPAASVVPALLLLATAAVSLGAAWRAPAAAAATATVGGLATVAATGGVLRTLVPADWAVPAYLLCAAALLGAVRVRAPRGVLTGLAAASGLVQLASALWAAPVVLLALTGPAATLEDVWGGPPVQDVVLPGAVTAPVVLAAVAVALWAAPRLVPAAPLPRPAAECAALALTWSAVVAAPAALALPLGPALAVHLAATAAALVVAVRPSLLAALLPAAGAGWSPPSPTAPPAGEGHAPGHASDDTAGPGGGTGSPDGTTGGAPAAARPGSSSRAAVDPVRAVAGTALVCALLSAASAALLGLATRPATFTALGVLVALGVAAATAARGLVRIVAACAAVVGTTGLAAATAVAAGLPGHRIGLALLAVPVAAALLGARLGRHPVALPVEATAAAVVPIAVALAVPHPPTVALVLALAGVVAAGTAVRAERRPLAGYAAAVLFVAATWVRLAASGVAVPEAYTLPVTVPALAVGFLRRRRDPNASSWVAYGPGLAATLVPSLLAAWGDPDWPRPLLLGLAALGVTLAGARLRLRAPLLLGGLTVALVALHELAPYVVQVVDALPRWLPPALAGLLLLAVGATYERRLRDARRLREALGRMR
ncbi:SCO7613 C-terminal domain-containing membrane protein [Streptomyces sp. NPDC001268]|uniref:SCO7613 C-terminal domain-containing membrane protein n=1 Tax=Streptomyces sp. NPDC001268 TaxID=3364553 RepID=UPI0036CCF4AA